MIVTTTYFNSQVLANLIESVTSGSFTGILASTKVMLFTNNLPLTPDILLSNLTEATFNGYARSATLTWGSTINEVDGSVSFFAQALTFRVNSTTPLVPNTIYGYGVVDEVSTPDLLFAELFPLPIGVQNPGDGFILVPKFNYGPSNPNSSAAVLR